MTTYKKYVDIFNQRKAPRRDLSADRSVATDKETYITFLETQLDKISNACLQVGSLTETTEIVKNQVEDMENKMSNATRLLKLLQSFADTQVSNCANSNENKIFSRKKIIQEYMTVSRTLQPKLKRSTIIN